MHLDNLSLPFWLYITCIALSSMVLLAAMMIAPWRALIAVQARQHAFLGGIIGLVIIWSMKLNWVSGLVLHPLGITAFTAIFGWPLAMIAGAISLIAHTALTHAQWHIIAIDFIFTVLIPATITHGVIRLVLGHASKNLFLYMLGIGFAGAILSMFVSLMLLALLAVSLRHGEWLYKLWHEAGIIAMLLYAEGFLNGMVVAAITVFAPDLVKTFDNRKYLGEK